MSESHDIKTITCTECGVIFTVWKEFAEHRDGHRTIPAKEKVHPPEVPH